MRTVDLTMERGNQIVLDRTIRRLKDHILILSFFFLVIFRHLISFFFFLPLLSYQNMLSEENMIIVMYNLYEFMHFISMELQTHWLLAWEMMLRALRLTCYVHCGQHSIRDMTLPCHTVY